MGRTRMRPKDYDAIEKLEIVVAILQHVAIEGYEGTAKEFAQSFFGIEDGKDVGKEIV